MAQFGWAYINCDSSASSGGSGQAAGPTGSIQFLTGANASSGSANFLYHTSAYAGYDASTLVLTGTLVVSGNISASSYTIKDISRIEASGSTFFGDDTSDTHARTGSLYMVRDDAPTQPYFSVLAAYQQTYAKAFRVGYQAISSATYSSSTANYIFGVTRTTDVEVRLHSASDVGAGTMILFKDEATSRTPGTKITISASSPSTIDGETYYILTGTLPSIGLYSNGSHWFVY
tara:strand:- start:123 stop:818 length:696 start_codon:yes stop_codon:yes gene_type:complete